MFKPETILATVDFGPRSKPAARHAAAIAKRCGARLRFLHVIPPTPYPAALASGFPGGLTWSHGPEMQRELEKMLNKFADEAAPGLDSGRIVVAGEPPDEIQRFAQTENADLVVMPTSDAGTAARLVLGSTATQVLGKIERPILTGAKFDSPPRDDGKPYQRIGCAVGLDSHSDETLRWAGEFADAFEADLWVMHASEPHNPDEEDGAREAVRALVEQAETDGHTVVKAGRPEEMIAGIADQEDLDVLVVGRHGTRDLLNGMLSNAFQMIRHAPCPVLSV